MASSRTIVTDNPNLKTELEIYRKQLDIKFINFSELLTNQDFILNEDKILIIVFVLSKETVLKYNKEIKNFLVNNTNFFCSFIINADLNEDIISQTDIENDLYYMNISVDAPIVFVAKSIVNAFTALELRKESFELKYKVNLSTSHISKLTKIGMSLGNEKDFTKLLRDILFSAREICVADAGSLYLVEKDEEGNPRNLRFKISALDLNSSEFLLPINKQSISGYVADTGTVLNIPDAYHLPPGVEYKFNSEYDKSKGYYSKSMLVVPMKNHTGEVIGVIQLINKKKTFFSKAYTRTDAGSRSLLL